MITPEDVARHRRLDMQANKMTADEFYRRQERLRAEAELVDRVQSDIHEETAAWEFLTGLTRDQWSTLLEEYGDLGVEIADVLACGDADSVEEARALLYRRAGDEAGEFIDRVNTMLQKRLNSPFAPDPFGELSREEFDALHPRRTRPRMTKSKLGEIADFERWLHGEG